MTHFVVVVFNLAAFVWCEDALQRVLTWWVRERECAR